MADEQLNQQKMKQNKESKPIVKTVKEKNVPPTKTEEKKVETNKENKTEGKK